MIVTLPPNTGLDHTLVVDGFSANSTMRATDSALSMSGKPTDASFVLGELGIPSLALGFAAGDIGVLVERMLREKGAQVAFTLVDGQSRINTVLVDRASGCTSTVTTSTLQVRAEHVAKLSDALDAALTTATCLVLGGTLPASLPPAIYATWINQAKRAQVPVLFDASQPFLRAGLAAQPEFIKPNRQELAALTGAPIVSLADAYHAGRALQQQHGSVPIITLDKDGALAVLADRALHVRPREVEVVSSADAADAVLAGLAAAISRGGSIEDGLRLGVAAAAAVCMMLGTAACARTDVERLLTQVRIETYAP
jgi:1-phosphofructokinase